MVLPKAVTTAIACVLLVLSIVWSSRVAQSATPPIQPCGGGGDAGTAAPSVTSCPDGDEFVATPWQIEVLAVNRVDAVSDGVRSFTPLPDGQLVRLDLAVVNMGAAPARLDVKAIAVVESEGNAPDTLVRVSEFDRYQGKGIPDGHVSLSLRLTFRAADRTLTDPEVQSAVDGVLAALKQHHAAVQR